MKYGRMTNKEIIKALNSNKYLMVRHVDFINQIGVNCKVLLISVKEKNPKPSGLSGFTSFSTCDIQEYITNKIPILVV